MRKLWMQLFASCSNGSHFEYPGVRRHRPVEAGRDHVRSEIDHWTAEARYSSFAGASTHEVEYRFCFFMRVFESKAVQGTFDLVENSKHWYWCADNIDTRSFGIDRLTNKKTTSEWSLGRVLRVKKMAWWFDGTFYFDSSQASVNCRKT